ncbi:MAG: P-loop NTPase fold protein [Sneathiella sp.]
MKIYCNGRALIEHALDGKQYQILPDELEWELIDSSERNMGAEALYEAVVSHDELGELRWSLSGYPIGAENYKNADAGKHRILEDFDYGLEHEPDYDADDESYVREYRGITPSIDEMVQWFHELYEDPQNETPYDSEEGGYIYVHGGPFDANDVLQEEFGSRVSDYDIEQAVNKIESDGTHEWAPSSSHPAQRSAAEEYDEERKRERRTGSGLFVKREAQEQILNREALALGLAHLFKSATGEFSFALLGVWGSGKTTLADSISKFLLDTEQYENAVKQAFGVSKADKKRYSTVKFNAWKYQKKPELWVYLYESFLFGFLSTNIFERSLRIIRVGLQKHGLAKALFLLLIVAFSAFPLMWISELLPLANAVFGVTGLIGLVFLAHRWRASLRKLYDLYGVVSSHSEHLGMQAVIGEDLKALVKSQVKKPQFTGKEKNLSLGAVVLIALSWLAWVVLDDGNGSKIPIYTALIIWSSIGVLFLAAMNWDRDRVDRILLIVDDLDRCLEEEILDLIDGVKLMVDDEEIGEFVQVLTLADSNVLCSAIAKKFELSSHGESDTTGPTLRTIEHIQKVFLCTLRLPVVSGEEVMDLVQGYANEFGIEDHDVFPSPSRSAPNKTASSHTTQTITNPTQEFGDFILSQSEVGFIKSALESHVDKFKVSMTPRTVRSFLFKYQILRMILRLNDVHYEPQELANLLIKEIALSLDAGISYDLGAPTSLSRYVKMVA